MSHKLWGGRFTGATDPLVESYTASIQFDQELVFEDLLGSLAHAAMLQQCHIISDQDHAQLQQGLQQIAADVLQGTVKFRMEDEDIHMNIERLIGEKIGVVAGKLHTARSRNDQVALDLHLYLRKQTIALVDLLTQLQQTLVQLAEEHADTILPGYTHLQRAQPIYLREHLRAYVAMLQRDSQRLQDLWPRVNLSPLGACALAGTTFATDRHYVAEILGFESIYENTLDAVSDRDFVIEFMAAGALIMQHLSRLSEELILWSSQEFNFISFADAYSTGSSIMPQKKNPDVAELARGKTGRVYGALFTLLTIMKGLPLAYNKDLQEDKEPLFDVVKTLRQTLTIYIPLLQTLKINTDKMRAAVQSGFLNATVLAEYLVKNGMPFRAAHGVVGKMVGYCLKKQCNLEDLSLSEMQQLGAQVTDDVYQILTVDAAAACRKSNTVVYQQQLTADQQWLSEKKAMLESVYTRFKIVI